MMGIPCDLALELTRTLIRHTEGLEPVSALPLLLGQSSFSTTTRGQTVVFPLDSAHVLACLYCSILMVLTGAWEAIART